MRRFLNRTVALAGTARIFILGLVLGMCIGVLAGRVAERFRLSDFVAIEQMILEREEPLESPHHGPPQLSRPNQPFRL